MYLQLLTHNARAVYTLLHIRKSREIVFVMGFCRACGKVVAKGIANPSCVISGVNAHEYRHYAKVGLPHIACADADAARGHNYLPASTCSKMT